MVIENNIFSNPPSMTSDQAIKDLRHHLTATEYFYCGTHLMALLDADRGVIFSVGSVKRYIIRKECIVCGDAALVVVLAR